jgi:hypothetical protein
VDANEQTLRATLALLAEEGRSGFFPSYLAKRSGLDRAETDALVEALVGAGELERRYQVRCPLCARCQASYPSIEEALQHSSPCLDCLREDDDIDEVWPVAPSRPEELDVVLSFPAAA